MTANHHNYKLAHTFNQLRASPKSLAFNKTGDCFAVACDDYIYILNTGTNTIMHEIRGEGRRLTFSHDDRQLISALGSTVSIWQVSDGSCISTWKSSINEIRAIESSSKGSVFACTGNLWGNSGSREMIEIWSNSDLHLINKWLGGPQGSNAISFRPDGKVIASGGVDGIVRVWKIPEGTLLLEMSVR